MYGCLCLWVAQKVAMTSSVILCCLFEAEFLPEPGSGIYFLTPLSWKLASPGDSMSASFGATVTYTCRVPDLLHRIQTVVLIMQQALITLNHLSSPSAQLDSGPSQPGRLRTRAGSHDTAFHLFIQSRIPAQRDDATHIQGMASFLG